MALQSIFRTKSKYIEVIYLQVNLEKIIQYYLFSWKMIAFPKNRQWKKVSELYLIEVRYKLVQYIVSIYQESIE